MMLELYPGLKSLAWRGPEPDKHILIDSFLKAQTRIQPDIIQMCTRT